MYHPESMRMIAKDRIEDLHRVARADRQGATRRRAGWPAGIVAWLRRRPLSLRPLSLQSELPPPATTVTVAATPPVREAASLVDLRDTVVDLRDKVVDLRDTVVDLRDSVVFLLDTGGQTTTGGSEGPRAPSSGAAWCVGSAAIRGRVESQVPDGEQHAVTGTGRAACTGKKVAFVFLSREWSAVAPADQCPACAAAVPQVAWFPRQTRYQVPTRSEVGPDTLR